MGCEGVRQAWQRRSSLMTIFGKFGAALARAGIVVSSDGSGGCPPVISKNGRLGNLAVPAGAGGELLLRRVLAQKLAERRRVSADDYRARHTRHPVVCRSVQRGGRREDFYPRIPTLLGASQRV